MAQETEAEELPVPIAAPVDIETPDSRNQFHYALPIDPESIPTALEVEVEVELEVDKPQRSEEKQAVFRLTLCMFFFIAVVLVVSIVLSLRANVEYVLGEVGEVNCVDICKGEDKYCSAEELQELVSAPLDSTSIRFLEAGFQCSSLERSINTEAVSACPSCEGKCFVPLLTELGDDCSGTTINQTKFSNSRRLCACVNKK
mmetsp:Transcript_9905/g.11325  ORF Transcript_9905/g.11325 Transcript_9905/m.11325 type:complete len:201 (+) Transcript_9905:317-919(+)